MRTERLLTGRSQPPDPPLELRAGPVSALLDGADLRHVRLGDVELVQRVYVAVRDAPWNTIPAVLSGWQREIRSDGFRVLFTARHRHEAIDFEWTGTVEGGPDGELRFTMDGICHGVFSYAKIGFNVHHALEGSIGRPYRARAGDDVRQGSLPVAIEPQRIVDGKLTGVFEPYEELAIEVADGIEAIVALEGDLLELQDHRNWADGNLKSYATPLALGFPFESTDGQRIRQVLTIRHAGGARPEPAPGPARITLGEPLPRRLPAIGFGQPAHGEPLEGRAAERIRAIRPAHLRVELTLGDGSWPERLAVALADVRTVGAALELAVLTHAGQASALDRLAAEVDRGGVPLARVLAHEATEGYSATAGVTPPELVALVAERLGAVLAGAPVGGGTVQSFSDVNRAPPTDPALRVLAFAASPTFHAADDASIVENLAGLGEVVRMAASFADGRTIAVGPITLATRAGPYPAGPARPGGLPPAVDVRQGALLGAAWTAAAIRHLAEAGADSATFYETTGWLGLMERASGSPSPDLFASSPSDLFPVWHVFRWLADWPAARLVATTSSDPLAADALAVQDDDGGSRLLVVNLRRDRATIEVHGLAGAAVRVRTLDLATAEGARRDESALAAVDEFRPVIAGRLTLGLGGYGLARVDPA